MATPEQQRRVDMGALRTAIESAGYDVVLDARVILLVRRGVESSIYDNGKVLLKTTDADAAQAAYDHLRPHLESAWA